jgi:two-component system response regulator AtoC
VKKTILLVDDDKVVRGILRNAFERKYDVLEASGCKDAIRQLAKPLDLAIVDFILPDAHGFRVLNILRAAKPKLPVIIMTAYGGEDLAIEAIRHEASDYIKKPVELPYLEKRLTDLIGG